MTSAQSKITANKLGEEKVQQRSAEADLTSPELESRLRDFIIKVLKQGALRKARECSEFLDDNALQLMVISMDRGNLEESSMVQYIHKIHMIYENGSTPSQLVTKLRNMDEDMLQTWFNDFDYGNKQRGDADNTRRIKFYAVKKLLEANGIREVDHVKIGFKKRRVEFEDETPTREDVQRMLLACKNTKQRILVRLLFQCFIRIGLAQLNFGDVWGAVEGKKAIVVHIEGKKSKCWISHRIVIPPEICELIRQHKEELENKGIAVSPETPLFTGDMSLTRRMTHDGIAQLARRIMTVAGVRGKVDIKANGARIVKRYKKRVHSARKSCRMEFRNNRGDPELANYLLGHKGDTYLRLQDVSDEELINEYLQHYPRIFEDADVMDHAINRVVGELRNLGLPEELCSKISQLLKGKLRSGERELPGHTGRTGDEESNKQAPESKGEFQGTSIN